MRILILHQYYCPPGGVGNNRSYAFAKAWAEAKHEVTVLTSAAQFPAGHPAHAQEMYAYAEGGVQVVVLRQPYAQTMGFWRRVWSFWRFHQKTKRQARLLPMPDIIFASSTPPSVGEAGRALAKGWNIPFVFEVVDVWPDVPIGMGILRNPVLKWFLNRAVNRIYAQAARVVALSPGMAQQVLSHGTDPAKVLTVVNGTDTDLFYPAVENAGVVQKPVVWFLYAGALGYANGVETLLRAAKVLEEQGLRFELHIYGWGSESVGLRHTLQGFKLRQTKVFAAVAKDDMPALMRKYDVGVVTFRPFAVLEHNSANKFYDYLASGLPVVLNYQGWQAELLAKHRCGLSGPMGDFQAFVANLARMVHDAGGRAAMGKNGRALAVAQFDRNRLAADLLLEMQAIASQHAQG